LPGKSMSQELHEHQGLVDVALALRDGVAQALVGAGGGWGHGGILALRGPVLVRGVTGGGTGGGELSCEVAYDGMSFRCDGGHEPAGSSKPC
jgi:hypothetical protein